MEEEPLDIVLDEETGAVITALLFNTLGGFLLMLGWLLFRKVRGDKQNVHRHMSIASNNRFEELYRDPSKVNPFHSASIVGGGE